MGGPRIGVKHLPAPSLFFLLLHTLSAAESIPRLSLELDLTLLDAKHHSSGYSEVPRLGQPREIAPCLAATLLLPRERI